jgi:AbrB family looped-hinge helix DNA binding protein
MVKPFPQKLPFCMANGIFHGMKKLKIDRAGRIVVPNSVRKHFHLAAGALLEIEIGENAIILRPPGNEPTLVEEGGLLVHQGEPSGDLLGAVETARTRRDRDTAGPMR